MNRKMLIVAFAIALILTSCSSGKNAETEPITIMANPSYVEMSIDNLISDSDLIVIGNLNTIYPSRWSTSDGKRSGDNSSASGEIIFTDMDFNITQMIKGDVQQKAARIRTLGGVVDEVQMIADNVIPEMNKTYLLFLGLDTLGSTAQIIPDHYMIKGGGFQGLYEIVGDKAISADEEWVLDELIAYIETSLSTMTSATSGSASMTDWVSKAMTINELTSEADLVVQVRVIGEPVTRVIRHELSVWGENNKIVGSTVSETLFSDTVFEIIKTYRGKLQLNITVMQTGGFDPTVSSSIEEVADDPLYKVGEEYILFLVDISGDKVQAPDRELYRIVNPFGRYRVDGEGVFSYGENLASVSVNAIKNVSELEAQIEQAINLIPIPVP